MKNSNRNYKLGRVYLYNELIGEATFYFGIQLTDK